MRVLRRYRRALAFLAALTASTVAFTHMVSIPSFIIIAPGYVVQAWLFERHWALGGVGYDATMIGVSSLFWTLVLLGAERSAGYLFHRLFRRRAADPGHGVGKAHWPPL